MARSPRTPARPEPGYYLLRRVRRGWAVPCRIWESEGLYTCMVDGEMVPGAWSEDDIKALWADWLTAESVHPIVQIQLHGVTCDEATYRHRRAMVEWAQRSAPDHPCLHPMRPIDIMNLPADEF